MSLSREAEQHLVDALVPIESLQQCERALPVCSGIAELDVRLLAPEQIGHQHEVAFLRVVVRHAAHRVVHAENLLAQHDSRPAAGTAR
jgi:hypothetical protein